MIWVCVVVPQRGNIMAKVEDKKSSGPIPIPTPLNISALARAEGVSRTTIQRRLKRAGAPVHAPPVHHPQVVHPPVHRAPRAPRAGAPPVHRAPVQVHPAPCTAAVAGLSLAAVSAIFSISGFCTLWPSMVLAIIAMGAALEFGKLAAVMVWHTNRVHWTLRWIAPLPILLLVGVNTVGVYGFLARGHVLVESKDQAKVTRAAEENAALIEAEQAKRAIIDDELARYSTARVRSPLVTDKLASVDHLKDLKIARAGISEARSGIEADQGQVKYLAELIGQPQEFVMRWFILVISFVLDPLAVFLWLCGQGAVTRVSPRQN